ncbi:hypothetical protein [Flagellimonas halotolerans]|uniref:Efflux transporter periplasmic adaptor subunit n=1 Tax=Flagellimonas halotolerans TaxID=3112164 RepID=A0ABU6IR33_9FLAO|nr:MULTISPECIES: hypothetical protein [unclassified Allomuricauda]MEC3965703.1 hypothetical protein [Muricauda sp. SYSU M86414]MEC4265570.1 hypothetical protein [Muricauda sp. SYSU M84420]
MKSKIHEHFKTNKLIVSKTVSKILMASMVIIAIGTTGCRDTKKEEAKDDHGHTHGEGADHTHEQEEVKQEEFTMDKDSVQTEEEGTHTHEDGETHHDH